VAERQVSEATEQTALFNWARKARDEHPELALMHHIPNGGTRNHVEAMRLKEQGVKSGVPDVCLPVPKGKYHALYIEMKRADGGKVSEDQRAWINALNRVGNYAVVCHGYIEARETILKYLRGIDE